jgi:hypothetical protein
MLPKSILEFSAEEIALNQCLKKAFLKVKIGYDILQSLKEIQS